MVLAPQELKLEFGYLSKDKIILLIFWLMKNPADKRTGKKQSSFSSTLESFEYIAQEMDILPFPSPPSYPYKLGWDNDPKFSNPFVLACKKYVIVLVKVSIPSLISSMLLVKCGKHWMSRK